jgi:tetratricopeptide (TPR) repeat protein
MAKGTLSREEIREAVKEDELGEALKRLLTFLQKNSRTLILALVVLIAAVVAWKLMEYRATKAIELSNLQLSEAQQKYSQAVFDTELDAAKRSELLDQSVATLESLNRTYPDTPAARLSLYLQGNAYLAKRDKDGATDSAEKAREIFRQYADAAPQNEDKARGLLGLAAAYENIGFLKNDPAEAEKAEAAYGEILALLPAKSHLVLHAKLSLARLLAAQGNTDKAVKLYQEIIAAAELPEAKKDDEPALTSADQQRRQFEKTVMGLLDQFHYAKVAEKELNTLVPPSAKSLKLDIPGVAAPAANSPASK